MSPELLKLKECILDVTFYAIIKAQMKKISLIHLKADHKGKVAEILGGGNLQDKLMNMGVYKGKEITKLSHIGLRGPVVIKTGRSILALGHGVAAKVLVEPE